MLKAFFAIATALTLSACASTSSVVMPAGAPNAARVAILPLEGDLGAQAVDLISQELAQVGVSGVERAGVRPILALDTDISAASPDSVQALGQLGAQLGVRYVFAGTVSSVSGPLYSYPHVNMTLRLIDVRSGQTRWLGHYGNAMWSSAISTQGDLQRGAKDIVREFVKAGGPTILKE